LIQQLNETKNEKFTLHHLNDHCRIDPSLWHLFHKSKPLHLLIMGRNSNRFGKLEDFKNQNFNFFHNGIEIESKVSYSISTIGEDPIWDYPGDSESTVQDLEVLEILVYSEYLDEWVPATITNDIEDSLLGEIIKYHNL